VTFEAVANTIRSRFEAQVAVAESLTTQYDNQRLPDNVDVNSAWCRFAIKLGDGLLTEIGGSKTHRYPGVAIAQLFVPIHHGDREGLRLADVIKTAFRAVTVSGVTFRTPSVNNLGLETEKKWWQINVSCPFYFNEIQ